MSTATILVPAAGAARRMEGRDKLLEPVEGAPLLGRVLRRACAVAPRVLVVLRPGDTARRAAVEALAAHGLHVIEAPDAAEGMSASLRAGLEALPRLAPRPGPVMILPADMPELTAADLRAVLRAWRPGSIARGCAADGRPGHPVVFPPECLPALRRLSGDRGAAAVLEGFTGPCRHVPLPGEHALTDLDTPQDWAAWRAGRAEG